jgi:hypothetical protein
LASHELETCPIPDFKKMPLHVLAHGSQIYTNALHLAMSCSTGESKHECLRNDCYVKVGL